MRCVSAAFWITRVTAPEYRKALGVALRLLDVNNVRSKGLGLVVLLATRIQHQLEDISLIEDYVVMNTPRISMSTPKRSSYHVEFKDGGSRYIEGHSLGIFGNSIGIYMNNEPIWLTNDKVTITKVENRSAKTLT